MPGISEVRDETMKCVIIVDENLPLGLIANTSAVLAMSIGKNYPELIGPDVTDQAGIIHPGITQTVIPLLKGNAGLIGSIRQKILEKAIANIYMVDFCDLAQQSKQYDEYIAKMQSTAPDRINYLGLGLYGPIKEINKLTGNIGLLR